MRYIFLTATFLLLSLNVFSQTVKDSVGPRIHFLEKSYDFGDVKQGETVSHIFQFKNTGSEDLKIVRAISNCSCTPVISDTSKIYSPGEMGEIRVSYDSETKPGGIPKQGVIQKQITVYYTSDYNKFETISIRLNVLPPIKKTSRSR